MSLLLQLYDLTSLTFVTVFLHAFYMLLPTFSLLILLMQTYGPQTVSRLGAKYGEDCSLSSRHNGGRIRIFS
jgi:hypothetical protein